MAPFLHLSVSVCVCVWACGYGCVCSGRGLSKDSVHCVFVYVRPQAEEDPSTQHEDGGSPAESIAPVKLVIGLKNCSINELDRVEDQSAGLQNHWYHKKRQTWDFSGKTFFINYFFSWQIQNHAGRVLHFYHIILSETISHWTHFKRILQQFLSQFFKQICNNPLVSFFKDVLLFFNVNWI